MKVNAQQVTNRFIQVGTIRKSHGLSGEVLAAFAGRTSLRNLEGSSVWITPPTDKVHGTIFEHIELLGDSLDAYVTFEGIDSLDYSSSLSRHRLICRREDVPLELIDEIEQKEYAPALLGYSVFSEAYGELGEVSEYLETKANDCLVVQGQYGEVLLPIIDEVILSIDEDARRIVVYVLPGLIDEDS